MNSACAIFIKQLQDILKNSGVLVQFVIFPFMAFLMTNVVDVGMPGMPESFFITMKAGMFVGMTLISTTATAIAEDREKNSLRFLLMAGVRSHEYLMGVGGVTLACALIICTLFAIMMPGASIIAMLIMLASLMLGAVASVLIGGTIGIISKNEQEATSLSMAAGMFLGFGPMIASISGNETLERIFRVFYTMNFIHDDVRTADAFQRFGIILANVIVFAAVFAWVYGKQESSKKGGIIMKKKVVAVMLAITLLGGSGVGAAIWHSAGFLETENARVTTNIVPIAPTMAGILERYTLSEGQRVEQGEVVGWVENNGPLRSPIDGVVVQSNAVQDQVVSPVEPVAVVADINRIHIQAHIEETDILRVHVGQTATVTIDAIGNQRFTGYVSEIGRITQAELTGNALFFNTGGNLTRVTHLIPIEIVITDDIDLDHLIGVNARVRIPLR